MKLPLGARGGDFAWNDTYVCELVIEVIARYRASVGCPYSADISYGFYFTSDANVDWGISKGGFVVLVKVVGSTYPAVVPIF